MDRYFATFENGKFTGLRTDASDFVKTDSTEIVEVTLGNLEAEIRKRDPKRNSFESLFEEFDKIFDGVFESSKFFEKIQNFGNQGLSRLSEQLRNMANFVDGKKGYEEYVYTCQSVRDEIVPDSCRGNSPVVRNYYLDRSNVVPGTLTGKIYQNALVKEYERFTVDETGSLKIFGDLQREPRVVGGSFDYDRGLIQLTWNVCPYKDNHLVCSYEYNLQKK